MLARWPNLKNHCERRGEELNRQLQRNSHLKFAHDHSDMAFKFVFEILCIAKAIPTRKSHNELKEEFGEIFILLSGTNAISG